jgi:ABC-2 type transport system ATP-binding protein
MSEAALSVSRLSARRGTRDVLTDVSFTVRRHEILGVIGPNGAGKTTLFECVAGVLPRASGAIDGDPLYYVPDGIRPWPEQTVRWTLALTARVFGAGVNARLVDELDLTRVLDQRVQSLSKGEAKRLTIALGLFVPRPILLLDEPFDGLDFRQTRRAIEVLRATRRTLVLSIHQLSDAVRVCDRFLLLDNGRAVGEGTLEELGGNLEEVFLARE